MSVGRGELETRSGTIKQEEQKINIQEINRITCSRFLVVICVDFSRKNQIVSNLFPE